MKKSLSFILIVIIVFSIMTNVFADEKNKNVIPIALATDNNYVLPTIVTMTSILENANSDTKYEYYILLSGNLKEQNKKRLLSIQDKYKNCSVKIFNMKDRFSNAYTSNHITVAAYYRLMLPSLLTDIDKVIYLDVDMIIKKDLLELFRTNIDDYYIAGVKNPHGYICKDENFNWADYLGIKSIDQYINSGMLVMNLEKMRKDNLEKRFLDFINNKITRNKAILLHDQDVINAVCYNKIYHLPCKYNVMLHYKAKNIDEFNNNKWLRKCYDKNEWVEAHESPYILHYSGWKKPWKKGFTKMYLAEEWWKYAKKTPYFNEIKQNSMKSL